MKLIKALSILLVLALLMAGAFWAGKMFSGHSMNMPMNMDGMEGTNHSPAMDESSMGATGEKKVKYWVAPMDANFRRDKPGESPMGMALVPVYDEPAGGNGADVSISATVQQNLGVRTALVERKPFVKTLKVVGNTGWNEASISMLHTRVEGWLETFNIASVGDRVSAGETLFEVFSPMLVTAQDEYLIARRSRNKGLIRASEKRLLSLGVTQSQINELERSGEVLNRLPHRAMRDGIVVDLAVRPGMFVMPSTNIATVVDDSSMWLIAEAFESDAAMLKVGQAADIEFDAFPGERFSGVVNYFYPTLSSATRTVQLRIQLPNPNGRLKANMFARVSVEIASAVTLQVPREAVIRSGSGSRVITSVGDGGFDVAVVTIGRTNDSHIEILEGLKAGDKVVTSGQFLLDAEANGEQATARLKAEKGGMSATSNESGKPQIMTAAKVVSIDLESRRIKLDHDDIQSLGMSAMTMKFKVDSDLPLDEYHDGDAVRFKVEMKPGQGMVITQMEKK